MNKKELRKLLKAQRNALTMEMVQQSSRLVAQQILACDAFQRANYVMGYLAFGKELSVDIVLEEALRLGKQVYVPYITSATEFIPVRLYSMDSTESFVLDRYGIRTPKEPYESGKAEALDLVLVPGVAFGRDGSRIGMGAGYYDRFLLGAKQAISLGVAYDKLLQDSIPSEEYDLPVDYIVTETRVFKPSSLVINRV